MLLPGALLLEEPTAFDIAFLAPPPQAAALFPGHTVDGPNPFAPPKQPWLKPWLVGIYRGIISGPSTVWPFSSTWSLLSLKTWLVTQKNMVSLLTHVFFLVVFLLTHFFLSGQKETPGSFFRVPLRRSSPSSSGRSSRIGRPWSRATSLSACQT